MDNNDINTFLMNLNALHNELKDKDLDHFEFFGLSKTATQKEIDEGYSKFLAEFHPDKGGFISDPEEKVKFNYILNRGKNAFDIISNYEKRAQYEKDGFREVSPDAVKEEEPSEKAKTLYRKAKALYQQKKFEIAVSALKQSLVLEEKADTYLLLGLSQTMVPPFRREAEQNLLKAAELESWNAEPYAALGMLFYYERLTKRAEGYFRKALEIEPGHDLAGKKLREIAGPLSRDIVGEVQDKLKKVLPSIFGRKKK